MMRRDPLAHASFAPLEGGTFAVRASDGARHTWQLAEVAARASGGGVENFTLRFTGGSVAGAKDGIYRVSHPKLGDVDLFVVAQSRGGTPSFTAVINRLV